MTIDSATASRRVLSHLTPCQALLFAWRPRGAVL